MDGYLIANPPVPQENHDLKNLTDYVEAEYLKIQAILTQIDQGCLTVKNVAPVRPRRGNLVYADGTNWNPAVEEGLVFYDGTYWRQLVASPAATKMDLRYNWSYTNKRIGAGIVLQLSLDSTGLSLNEAGAGAAGTIVLGTIPYFQVTAAGLVVLPRGQLQWPSVPSLSVDPNTIDDFQRGLWTPGLTFVTPGDQNIVLSPAVGDYYKIGKWVIASFRCNSSTFSFTTASGSLNITGLPYPASSDANFVWPGPLTWGGITKAGYTSMACEVIAGTSVGVITASGSGVAPAIVAASDMPSGGTVRLRGTLIYRT